MRIEQLTFTRFIAAVSIVVFHYGKHSPVFNNDSVSFFFGQANVGVSYFFVLSGFVMVIAYNKSGIVLSDYFKSRFARIYPVYFLASILFLMELITSKEAIFKELVLSLLMIQAWFPGQALTFNYPAWSISVELFFYLLFPFLFNFIYQKVSFKKLLLPVLAIWIATQFIVHLFSGSTDTFFSGKDLLYLPAMHLNEFLAGNLAGLYFISASKGRKRNYDLAILMMVGFLVFALKYPFGLIYHNGLLVLVFIPLILLMSFNTGQITQLFKKKACVFLGEISFGFYILQYPVWTWISNRRLKDHFAIDQFDDATLSFCIRFSFLLLVSALSYVYLEKPVREWARKTTSKPIIIKS